MKTTSTHERFSTTEIAKHILVFNYDWAESKECNHHYVSFSERGNKRAEMIGQWNVKLKNC